MATNDEMRVSLAPEMAGLVRAKVASGEYANESDVIEEALRTLADRESTVEAWLRDEVVAAYDSMRADPTQGISLEEMRTMLAEDHRQSFKTG